jgi:hypothetical protein
MTTRCGSHWEDKVKCVSAWAGARAGGLVGPDCHSWAVWAAFLWIHLFKLGKEKEYPQKKGKEKEEKRFEHLIT